MDYPLDYSWISLIQPISPLYRLNNHLKWQIISVKKISSSFSTSLSVKDWSPFSIKEYLRPEMRQQLIWKIKHVSFKHFCRERRRSRFFADTIGDRKKIPEIILRFASFSEHWLYGLMQSLKAAFFLSFY